MMAHHKARGDSRSLKRQRSGFSQSRQRLYSLMCSILCIDRAPLNLSLIINKARSGLSEPWPFSQIGASCLSRPGALWPLAQRIPCMHDRVVKAARRKRARLAVRTLRPYLWIKQTIRSRMRGPATRGNARRRPSRTSPARTPLPRPRQAPSTNPDTPCTVAAASGLQRQSQ